MRGALISVGLAAGLGIGCAAGAPTLRLSDEAMTDDGLHLVRQPGRGQLLVSPDLQRVRREIRETEGAVLHCQVALSESAPPATPEDRATLERSLCDAVRRSIVERPRPQVGPGSGSASQIVTGPGPGIMAVQAWLIDAEIAPGGTLAGGKRPTFSMRLNDSLDGKPVMRYYEKVSPSTSLEQMVDRSMDQVYDLYERILNTAPRDVDVAAPPPGR